MVLLVLTSFILRLTPETAKEKIMKKNDIRKLKKLGYKPKIVIKEGLIPTANWYTKNSKLNIKE